MKYKISLLFLSVSCAIFAQDFRDPTRVKLGTEISTTFSRLEQNGLTPFITLKKNRIQFAVGPRFVYSSFDDYEIRNKDNQVFTLDANFRYYASIEPSKIRPYIQFSLEYQYGRNYAETFYDHQSSTQILDGPIFPYSFNLGTEKTRHNLNMYTNLGFEAALSEHIFIANSIGLGMQTQQKTLRYVNVDSGQLEARNAENLAVKNELGWMVNVGLGFRF